MITVKYQSFKRSFLLKCNAQKYIGKKMCFPRAMHAKYRIYAKRSTYEKNKRSKFYIRQRCTISYKDAPGNM